MTAVERKVVHLRLKDVPGRRDRERGRPSRTGSSSSPPSAMTRGSRWLEALVATPGLTAIGDPRRLGARYVERLARGPSTSCAASTARSSTWARAAASPGIPLAVALPEREVDAARGERAQVRVPASGWAPSFRTCASCWGRAEEQETDWARRRRREGARAAAGRGRVVPAARRAGRRGVLYVGPSADAERGRARGRAARRRELGELAPGCSCCARSRRRRRAFRAAGRRAKKRPLA